MTNRFIKFIPSEEAEFLLANHPNAFLLLTLIAMRARRVSGKSDGLEIGECHIGDYEACGLSRSEYRTALKHLSLRMNIRIIENCRTRKKLTTGLTTKGTKVKLLKSDIWDINSEHVSHQVDQRLATASPPVDHEQERIRSKKKEKEIKETISKEPQAASIVSSSFLLSERIEEEVKDFEELAVIQGFAFQRYVIVRWIKQWGKDYVNDIYVLLIKEVELCESNPKKKPIKNPEAWMQTALDRNYIKMGEKAQKNMELSRKLRQNGWPNLEIRCRHAGDPTTGKEYYYNNINFEELIMFEYERIIGEAM